MHTPGGPKGQDSSNHQQRLLIWGAMLSSVALYGGIAQVVKPPAAAEPDTLMLMSRVLPALSLMQTIAVLALPRLLPSAAPLPREVVGWALAESIAIFGLLLHFLGAPPLTMWIQLAWAVLLLLVQYPKTQRDDR